MKKKRTGKTVLPSSDHPLFGQTVAIHSREQVRHTLREIAQLRRHTAAIEADAYQSLWHICRTANRFLAPRRLRMEALVAGLVAFKTELWRAARRRGGTQTKRGGTRKKTAHFILSHSSTQKKDNP